MVVTLLAACSQDIQPPEVRNLNRPTDIAFACFGDLRLTGVDCDQPGACPLSAQPIESCLARMRGEVPPGQEETAPPTLIGFVLQSGPGTIALLNTEPIKSVRDSDPLTPGINAIPIGTLPVGIVADQVGCTMVAANAGTCDLSVLDINSVLARSAASISRVEVVNTAGDLIQAKPRDIAGRPAAGEIGVECPGGATGLVYVAYPECNLVAAVDSSTGQVVAGIRYNPDGTQVITAGDVSCPQQCGSGLVPTAAGVIDAGIDAGIDGGAPDAGGLPPLDPVAGRPVALRLNDDGTRLFVGAENMPIVLIAELDAAGLPTALSTIRLEGDIGVTELNVTDVVQMGGELGMIGGTAGAFQFVYAIATDSTVRVADLGAGVECDTQVDPRFVHDQRNVALLACLPVGGVDTPPRRAGARGPGIDVFGVPTSVSFAQVEPPPGTGAGAVAPTTMVGYYAFITTTSGFVFVITIDDDNYPDFEDEDDPARAAIPLAIAHQVRDFVFRRDEISVNDQGETVCSFPNLSEQERNLFFGPRLGEPPAQVVNQADVAVEQAHQLPLGRQVACESTVGGNASTVPVSELAFAAPVELRELAFPDLAATRNERWFFTWEGTVSIDQPNTAVDGPPTRSGIIRRGDGRVELVDGAAPFCAMGAQPYDVVALVGCDPSRGDADCGIGESCFVHPDSPASLSGGMCVADDERDQLAASCRDLMITRRRYTVLDPRADRVRLIERRRALITSPLGGCTSAQQCEEMFEVERRLGDPAHPLERGELPPLDFEPTFACEVDPTRAPGPPRCLMACTSADQCEDGFSCSRGYCVEAKLPPVDCLGSLQRYQLRVGDAFAVVGERQGFLHNRIRDEATGECIDSPTPHPLLVGRIPLRPPACTGEGLTAVTPNPCSTTVEHVEEFVPFEPDNGLCVPRAPTTRTRTAPAVRFSNPAFSFHIVDTETTGDAECRADISGDLPPFSAVHPGYRFSFLISSGFLPMFVQGMEAAFPIQSVEGPDGLIWVLDQGDDTSTTKGQVFVLDPRQAANSFGVVQIR